MKNPLVIDAKPAPCRLIPEYLKEQGIDARAGLARPRVASEVVVFNRDAEGFRKGETGRVREITAEHVVIETGEKIRSVPFKHLDRVNVCEQKQLSLSSGDRLRVKANGKAAGGETLANGELVTVGEVRSDGSLKSRDSRVIPKTFRQFIRGYAVTSYGSQGKTLDHVLFSDSMVKAATNDQQWYVTISRGRKGITIFTTDKAQLRENVARSGNRELALELVDQGDSPLIQFAQARGRLGGKIRAFAHAIRVRAESWRSRRRKQSQTIQKSGVRI